VTCDGFGVVTLVTSKALKELPSLTFATIAADEHARDVRRLGDAVARSERRLRDEIAALEHQLDDVRSRVTDLERATVADIGRAPRTAVELRRFAQ